MSDDYTVTTPKNGNGTLARLATLLGCRIETVLNGEHDPLNVKGASELLAIWTEMDDGADRAELLAFARALAAKR